MTAKTEKHETFTSAKAKYANLLAQRARLEEVEGKNRTDADNLRTQLHEAEGAHRTCEKLHIRGVASADELAAAKALTCNLREQLAEAERMVGLASDALAEMREEISDARNSREGAFVACCGEVMTGISDSFNNDKNIRAKLLTAYAAWAHSGAQYRGRWTDFLAGIFNHPSAEEIQSAMAEFKPKHLLE